MKSIVLVALVLGAAGGWCSDPAFAGRKAVVFPITDLSAAGMGGEREASLSEAVNAGLQAAGFTLLPGNADPEESVEGVQRLSGPRAAAAARDVEADVAVSGFYTIEDDRIVVLLSCYEAQSGALAAGFLKSWRLNLTFYNYLRSEIESMLAGLTLPDAPGRTAGPAAEITFTSALDGMEVLFGGERSVGTIEHGKLAVPAGGIRDGSPILVEKRMAGYHGSLQTVRAAREVALTPLARKTTVALEASWTAGEFLGGGAAARLYLLPDSLYLSGGLTVSAEPLTAPNAGAVTHYDALFLFGQYLLFPPESPLRMGIGTGAGVILTTVAAAGPAVYTDAFWDVVSLWVEWSLPRFSLSLRSDMKYTLGVGTNLLGRGILMWRTLIPTQSGSPVGIEFPPLTLGVVWKL